MVSELLINCPRSDEFMLIACDGIWNVLTSQAAVSFVREQIAEYKASDKCSKTWLSDIAGQVNSFPPHPPVSSVLGSDHRSLFRDAIIAA